MMVATQLRFHRRMLDGEQVGSKPLTFPLRPNLELKAIVQSTSQLIS